MYLSYLVYAICIALILWGGKFAGFKKDSFHENSFSLDVTKSLRGLAAFGVILHHVSQNNVFQNANGYGKPGELSIFVNAGFFFVSIFFFCSGFGLIKSMNNKENYFNDFIKKRVVKTLLIPFYVNVILYAIVYVIIKSQIPVAQWITNFLGLTLMNPYAWYPIVAILLYLAFYFIFKNCKNKKLCYLLMFLVIFLQGVFFCFNGHFAWWSGPKNWWLTENAFQNAKWWQQERIIWFFGEWWVNSSPAFLVGILFAQYEEKIRNWIKKYYWLKLLGIIAIFIGFHLLSKYTQSTFGYWSEFNGKGPGILNKFICYCAQIPQVSSFVIMIYIVMMKFYSINPVTKFFGNISYETYMMNLIPLDLLVILLYKQVPEGWYTAYYAKYNANLGLYLLCVTAGTIILGLLFKHLNKQVNKLIK